jgi:ADP-ribose pyrophosphatase YjhB (NUDIX family)
MCRRAQEPARGQWSLPSGFLECGETLEEGAARETFEETGVIVDPLMVELCAVVNMTAIEQVAVLFRTELTAKPVVRPGPECLEVAFIAEGEIPVEQIAWRSSLGDAPRRFFNGLRSRHFTVQLVSIGSDQGIGFKSREYAIASITRISNSKV